ncbi:MAG: hypothetical protein U0R44_00985 [Candidatus Micrarchaeia archaeon]
MHKGKTNFGTHLEQRGDYRRALGAYSSQGSEEDVKRVRSKITALESAKRLEDEGYLIRSVDMLLENGLVNEAGELVGRTEKAETAESCYAKLRVLALRGDVQGMERPYKKLARLGAHGIYLFGMALADSMPQVARRAADELSGRKLVEVIAEQEKEPGIRLFIAGKDPGEIADHMLAMTFWGMQEPDEMVYFALRIYQKLQMDPDAERCRSMLENDGGRYRLYDLLREGGWRAVSESGIRLDNLRRYVCAIAEGKTDLVIRAIEGGSPASDEERYKISLDLLHEIDRYAPELLDTGALESLISYSKAKREELGKRESDKLEEFDRLVESGEMTELKAAKELLGKVSIQYLDVNYWDQMARCADAAVSIGSEEALAFAGEIYHRTDMGKALMCADALLEIGCLKAAREIYSAVGTSVSYSRYSDRREKAENPVNEMLGQRLMEKAYQIEGRHPAVSLGIYKELRDEDGVKRTARAVLEKGSFEEIGMAAWAVSTFEKDGLLMRDAILRLEEFGDEGRKTARGICLEMRVPKVFVAK